MVRPSTVVAGCIALLGCASRDPVGARTDASTDSFEDTTIEDTGKPFPAGAEEALAAYHAVFCKSYGACFPVQLSSLYGDVDGCIARRVKGSLRALFGVGSKLTAAQISACTAAYPATIGCDEVLEIFGGNPIILPACRRSGDLANDSSCSGADQCQSGFCKFDGVSRCGRCSSRTALGGACKLDTDCTESAVCAGGKCVGPGAENDPCSATAPCKIAFACSAGKCTKRVAGGTKCDPAVDDCVLGQYCNTISTTCESYQLVKAGDACGPIASGGLAFCAFGNKCKQQTDGTYKCVPAGTEGQACSKNTPTGPTCETPLQCLALSCVMIDSDACR